MARLNLNVGDKLLERFKELAYKKFGPGKGSLKKAAEKAFEMWLKSLSESELVRLVRDLKSGDIVLYCQDEKALGLLERVVRREVACKLVTVEAEGS